MPELCQMPEWQSLFDWEAEVQRLEIDAARTLASGKLDPWTFTDAACSLDLVEQEVAACSAGLVSLAKLERCRSRLRGIVAALENAQASQESPQLTQHQPGLVT